MCATCVTGFEAAAVASTFAASGLAMALRRARVLATGGADGLRAWRAEQRALADERTRAYLTDLGLDADAVLAAHPRPPVRVAQPGVVAGAGSVRRMIVSTSR